MDFTFKSGDHFTPVSSGEEKFVLPISTKVWEIYNGFPLFRAAHEIIPARDFWTTFELVQVFNFF